MSTHDRAVAETEPTTDTAGEEGQSYPAGGLTHFWGAVSPLAGPNMGSALHNEALSILAQFGIDPNVQPDDEQLRLKYQQAVVLALVKEMQPAWPPAFVGESVMDDLLQILRDSGRPRILRTDNPNGDHRIQVTARANFVLGVIYRCARDGLAQAQVFDRLRLAVSEDRWKDWSRLISSAEREAARAAGREGRPWNRSTDDDALRTLFRTGSGKGLT